MKIALIGPVYPYRGGIAHYTTFLAQRLREKHNVLMISYRRQYPRWLFPGHSDRDPSEHSIQLEDVHYLLDAFSVQSWFRTLNLLKLYEPDLLLTQWWTPFWAPSLITILARFRSVFPEVPIFTICHNIVSHEEHWWDNLVARLVLRLPDHCIVHSESSKIYLLHILPNAKITLIGFPQYEGLISVFYSRADARNKLGIQANESVLLFFGFVRPYKGLEYLLHALAKVNHVLSVRLLIVGEFWHDKQNYLRLIDDLGIGDYVTIVDEYVPNEEIGLYFAAADVLVLPYIKTSQSAVVQLAFETDTPVIASNVSGVGEYVVEGVNGLLVMPGDIEDLAQAITRYFQNNLATAFRQSMPNLKCDRWKMLIEKIEELSNVERTIKNTQL
ncbi:MAG TPA: glycosyltransferase [Anaerolineae bacterium]|nr:glycosyltransferase [Anaerolineae bacterium]